MLLLNAHELCFFLSQWLHLEEAASHADYLSRMSEVKDEDLSWLWQQLLPALLCGDNARDVVPSLLAKDEGIGTGSPDLQPVTMPVLTISWFVCGAIAPLLKK